MARGMGLTALIVVLVLVHQTCNTSADQDHCPPSSCGSIPINISYPFRLTSDPKNCGDQRYNLSCENNQTLVLHLYGGRYYVRQINYTNYKIRVVDPSIGLNATEYYSFIPRYSLDEKYFSLGDPYQTFDFPSVIFMKCEKPMNLQYQLNISTCIEDGVYSNSKRYTYALFGYYHNSVVELEDLCQVEQISLASLANMYYDDGLGKNFCKDFHNELLRGFELFWYRAYCGSCEHCYLDTANNIACFGGKPAGILDKIYGSRLISKLKIAGVILGPFLILLSMIFALYRIYSYDKLEKEHRAKIEKFLEDYRNFKPTRYSYADIKRITNQFIEKLGEGAYGTVFKGKLSNEIHVAVKILNTYMGNGEEFINEVGTMARIHHVNVVRLVGYCADGFRRALVYEFLPNDSLDKFISSTPTKNRIFNWVKLQDIAFGVAKGIEYLHQGCDQQILHFDIKPHNVLLDQNFNPKISDFGLAKLCSKDQSAVSMTTARGTMGYIAPEVFSRNFGNVSAKADVYSFGILLLEIVGGRKNVDVTLENTSQVYFPEWIYNLLEQKEDIRIFVEDDGDAKIAKKLAIVGLWCIQWHPIDRPSIKNVVQMLEGEGDKLTMPPNPFASVSPIKTRENMPTKRLNNELEVILESE